MQHPDNSSPQRCTRCIMPVSYPGIRFNGDGVCSLCTESGPAEYRGHEAFKEDIGNLLRSFPDRLYDGVIGLSGGRDSTYLLHLLVRKFNCRVIAFFVDHGLIPVHTRENVRKITRQLGVKLVVLRHDSLEYCFSHQFKAWQKNPRVQTIATFCMGCKSTIIRSFYKVSRKYRAPLLFYGWTPFEDAQYKMSLMKTDPFAAGAASYIGGYAGEIVRNPHLVANPRCLLTQIDEFMHFYGPAKHLYDRILHTVEVKLFEHYVRWTENEAVDCIVNGYGWRSFDTMSSSWRGDCYLGPIRQHLYRTILGYNDHTPHLSALIRDGQLTRTEALARVDRDESPGTWVIEECCRHAGISVEALNSCAERTLQEYRKVSVNRPEKQ